MRTLFVADRDEPASPEPGRGTSGANLPFPTLSDIRVAAERIRGQVQETPCLPSQTLSGVTGAEVWLKFENLQFTASFKERGALNKILSLDENARAAGFATVSAGNHAQGLAWHAKRLGCRAVILMPETAPVSKVKAVERFGARVVLMGATFADAAAALPELARAEGLTIVHPFDDFEIVAGQGTVGLEMLAAAPELDTLVIPVGGGGLASGIALAAKALKPSIRIVGVQSELYSGMAQALGHAAEARIGGPSVAEGIAVKEPGALTRAILAAHMDALVTVPEALIEDAVALLIEIEKTVVEGAGAAGIAAMLHRPELFEGRKCGVVLCGGNIDTRALVSVLQRHLVRNGLFIRLGVTAADSAGSLGRIASIIGRRGGNILELRHERAFGGAFAKETTIEIDIELREKADRSAVIDALEQAGFGVEDHSRPNHYSALSAPR